MDTSEDPRKDQTFQELLLFGQVPWSRHDQVLKILAGLTAMPEPRRIFERNYVFKPNKVPVRRQQQIGGSQDIETFKVARKAKAEEEVYYQILTEDLTLDSEDEDDSEEEFASLDDYDRHVSQKEPKWTLHVSKEPESGARPVMSRTKRVVLVDSKDPIGFVRDLDSHFVHQYVVEGYRFVYNSIILRLQRCISMMTQQLDMENQQRAPISQFRLVPLDPNGGYVIQASLAVADGNNIELTKRGTNELNKLKEDMKGCIDLKPIERLSMDTRVR